MRILTSVLTGAFMTFFLGATGFAAQTPAPEGLERPGAQGGPEQAGTVPELLTGKQEQIVRLSNGFSVLILKDTRFPLVSTRLYVHAGSAYERPEQAGISHVLEHMVFKGTESRPKSRISQEVEAAGGEFNAMTSFDYTVYLTDLPARHWKLGMDVVRDMAFHATLDPMELESEKNVIVSELKRGQDDPGNVLFWKSAGKALSGTPYEHPVIGSEQTIRAVTVQSLRAYIAALYQPQNMLLVVVGDVEPKDVLAAAEELFGGYKNHGELQAVAPVEASLLPLKGKAEAGPSVTVQAGPWNKVYLTVSFPQNTLA